MLSTSSSIRPYLGSASNIKAILRAFNGDGVRDECAFPGSGDEPACEEAEGTVRNSRWGGDVRSFPQINGDVTLAGDLGAPVLKTDRVTHRRRPSGPGRSSGAR